MADTKLSKYGYDISVNFIYGSKSESIPNPRILSMVINSDYYSSSKIQPSIYLSISVNTTLYNKILDKKGTAQFVIKNLKYNYVAKSISKKKYFNKEFDYIVYPNTYSVGGDDTGEVKKDDYRKITIGLYSKKSIEDNEKEIVNGIYPNTNTISIIHNYTSHMKMVIEKFIDNDNRTIAIPPINSVSRLLRYLNDDVAAFYDSKYIYFQDFNYTYLVSSKGVFTDAKDSSYGSFKFNIQDLNSDNKEGGMILNNKMYIVNVDSANVDIKTNNINDIKIDNISTISPTGKIRTTKISSGKKNRFIKLSHDNPNYINQLRTEITSQKTNITITKVDIDASVFTPNKEYNIIAKSSLKYIEGKYQLISKREVYIQDNEKFICTTSLQLQKIIS